LDPHKIPFSKANNNLRIVVIVIHLNWYSTLVALGLCTCRWWQSDSAHVRLEVTKSTENYSQFHGYSSFKKEF